MTFQNIKLPSLDFIGIKRILKYYLFLCVIFDHVISDKKEFIRSYHSLSSLALNEKYIYETLKNYSYSVNENKTTITELTSYLDEFEDSTGQFMNEHDFDKYVAMHPLLSSRMIHRYAVDLPNVLMITQWIPKITDIIQRNLQNLKETIGWPAESDVKDTWRAILRVVHVYDLNISQFAIGNILGIETKSGLRAKHCFLIAKFAIDEKYFSQAVEWLEFAKILIKRKKDDSIEIEAVRKLLDVAVATHDFGIDKLPIYESKLFTDKLENSMCYPSLRQSRRNFQYDYWKGGRAMNYNEINFWGLCSGDDLRTEEEKRQLFCWSDNKSNPALFINPLKIEQLAKSPDVIQIYEAISNTMCNKLIHLAKPNLFRSRVNALNPDEELSTTRTSTQAWLNDRNVSLKLTTIAKRIELITKLAISPKESSEIIQIASYSFGGQYEPHLDTSPIRDSDFNLKYGERIATFMIYLTDVQRGGYTAFPQAGVAAKPVKGSAVFWYNMKRNGDIDRDTHHGGCPIVLGSKWVANKWIRSFGQIFKRSCSLDPNE